MAIGERFIRKIRNKLRKKADMSLQEDYVKLIKHEMSDEEFLKENRIENIEAWEKQKLSEAIRTKDAVLLEIVFFVIFHFKLEEAQDSAVLRELLAADWHYKHEDIVDLLEFFGKEEDVEALYRSACACPAYIEEVDAGLYTVRCIRAMHGIGMKTGAEEKAISYLQILSGSDDERVREIAERKIKELEIKQIEQSERETSRAVVGELAAGIEEFNCEAFAEHVLQITYAIGGDGDEETLRSVAQTLMESERKICREIVEKLAADRDGFDCEAFTEKVLQTMYANGGPYDGEAQKAIAEAMLGKGPAEA